MSDKTVEELCEALEQHPDFAERHSQDVKLKNGAVWNLTRIRIADKEVANR